MYLELLLEENTMSQLNLISRDDAIGLRFSPLSEE
jgi:hypothetical protein